jgi:hypothetical protein
MTGQAQDLNSDIYHIPVASYVQKKTNITQLKIFGVQWRVSRKITLHPRTSNLELFVGGEKVKKM